MTSQSDKKHQSSDKDEPASERTVTRYNQIGAESPDGLLVFHDDYNDLLNEISGLREKLADAYVLASGKMVHASDCATSCAPAEVPGPCDCSVPPPKGPRGESVVAFDTPLPSANYEVKVVPLGETPELIAALRARCPGNGDSEDEFVCECQSYEAGEQGAPCPPGCCVMAEAKDVRAALAAIEEEDAPVSAPSATRRMTDKQLEALRMLNDAFESHDGRPVDQAIIAKADYRLLYEALAEGTAGDRIAADLLVSATTESEPLDMNKHQDKEKT